MNKPKATKPKAAKAPAAPRKPTTQALVREQIPASATAVLLPYQVAWLRDKSQLKILEKSRRIGGTYVQALEDVLDCKETPGLKVWFSSADLTAGTEYLDYVQFWIRTIDQLTVAIVKEIHQASLSDLDFANEEKDFKARVVEFANGSKITILSSSPTAFRSKGGKVIWDEAAHHKADRKMWAAAQPVATWGHSIRVLSTHNCRKTVFYQLCNPRKSSDEDEQEEDFLFSKHRVTILDAIEQGMLDKVLRRKATEEEKIRWLRRQRRMCISEDQWQEEFLCNAMDESTALLTYDMILGCECDTLDGLDKVKGPLYLGMDLARKRHRTVIYVLELCGRSLEVRLVKIFEKTKFSVQADYLNQLIIQHKIVRACIDETGIGMMFAEQAADIHGKRVEGITFSPRTNEALATALVAEFEDVTLRIPSDRLQRESLHSMRCIVTTAGKKRFDAKSEDASEHGDFFWALALAVHAARDSSAGPVWARSVPRPHSTAAAYSRAIG